MSRFFIIGIFLSALVTVSSAQSRKKAPEWVFTSPGDGLFYYGIGSAPVDEKSDYRKIARENAIREIAEKLLVRINSTSSLQTKATKDAYSYLVDSDIQTHTINSFEDLRLDEDWLDESNDTYYALYKLDINQYRENRQRYMDLVLDTFQEYADQAKAHFESGEYNLWLRNLEEALLTIKPDMNRLVELDYHTRLKYAEFTVEEMLRRQLMALGVVSDFPQYEFDPLGGVPTRIMLSVKSVSKDLKEGILPLKIKELKGDVFRSDMLYTSRGTALEISGMLPEESEVVFQLYLDLPSELSRLVNASDYPLLLSPVKVKFKTFHVNIQASESVLGHSSDSRYLHEFFSDFLAHCAIDGKWQTEDSQYEMILNAQVKPVEHSSSEQLKGVSLRVDLEIRDRTEGVTLLKDSKEDWRGYGTTYTSAVRSAYGQFAETSDPILEEIVKVLCGLQ